MDVKIRGAADAINIEVSYSDSKLFVPLEDRRLITCVSPAQRSTLLPGQSTTVATKASSMTVRRPFVSGLLSLLLRAWFRSARYRDLRERRRALRQFRRTLRPIPLMHRVAVLRWIKRRRLVAARSERTLGFQNDSHQHDAWILLTTCYSVAWTR